MNISISEMPESKSFDDYPENTEFVLEDRQRRFDKKALENNLLVEVLPDHDGYDEAITIEDAKKMFT